MARQDNLQLYPSPIIPSRAMSRFQVMFLGESDCAVDVQETEDLDLEEIRACILLGGKVFITGIP